MHPVTREVKRLREDFLLETGAWYEHVVESASSDANAEVNFSVHWKAPPTWNENLALRPCRVLMMNFVSLSKFNNKNEDTE